MRLRWSAANRCRADARVTRLLSQPGRNSPQFQWTSFVSQQHWTTHYSTQMQPQLWNNASLRCRTVTLYCHCSLLQCCSWTMAFFSTGHASTNVSDDKWHLQKNTISFQQARHTHAKECSRTTKLEGWNSQCMPQLRCISCSHSYGEVGRGPGEHLDWWLSVYLDSTAMARSHTHRLQFQTRLNTHLKAFTACS